MPDLASLKAAARAEAAASRARAHAANPLAGETLAALFPASWIRSGTVVAGYAPFRTEIDPRPLMRRLERLGARLALPVTPASGVDGPLAFRAFDRSRPLAAGRYGIPEPDEDCAACEPDVVLVPLLAFDRLGGRLGYGAGWYDRTLAALRATRVIAAVGLAFSRQEVARAPSGAHDRPLDAVCTETRFLGISH